MKIEKKRGFQIIFCAFKIIALFKLCRTTHNKSATWLHFFFFFCYKKNEYIHIHIVGKAILLRLLCCNYKKVE